MKNESARRALGILTIFAAGFGVGTLIAKAERAMGGTVAWVELEDGTIDEKSMAVLERCYTAMGGLETLRSVVVRSAKGEVEIPAYGMKGTVFVAQTADGRTSQTTELAGMGTVVRGYDGTHAWEMQPGVPARLLEGAELEDMRSRTGMVFGVPLEPKVSHRSITHTGEEVIEGETYDVLRAESRSGRVTTWSFARSSGLLLRETTTEKGPMGEVLIELVHTDPVTVEGITSPSGAIQRIGGGPMGTMEIRLKTDAASIAHGASVNADLFKPPPEIQTLIDAKK
jgi:hypothetical protein